MTRNVVRTCAPRIGLCALLIAAPVFAACSRAQKPVLDPNAKVQQTSKEQVGRDIEDCRRLASEYVESTAGKDIAKGAAVGGGAGAAVGAAVGAATGATAGAVHGAVKNTEPKPVYKQFVNRCLRERGYDVMGWQ
jgi:hypothetical protein